MTQDDFVLVYVIVPLVVALGWLLWRARRFLRDLAIYTAAVAVLLLVVHLGHAAWSAWAGATANWDGAASEPAPYCIDVRRARVPGACWS